MDYEKVYVAVTLKVDREGNVRPLSFEWEDGRVLPSTACSRRVWRLRGTWAPYLPKDLT